MASPARTCLCGLPLGEPRTVAKNGPNHGRKFLGCPRFNTDEHEARCKFFEWVDGASGAPPSSRGSQPTPAASPAARSDPDAPVASTAHKFYRTPSLPVPQEPTPHRTLPQTTLPSFGARLAALSPQSPTPAAADPPASPLADDAYLTPLDAAPPWTGIPPPAPKKRPREVDQTPDVRPRRLFPEAFADGADEEPSNNPVSSTETKWADRAGGRVKVTNIGVQTPRSFARAGMTAEDAVAVIRAMEQEATRKERQLKAAKKRIDALLKDRNGGGSLATTQTDSPDRDLAKWDVFGFGS